MLIVVGARPNFIKIAPLCRVLSREAGLPFKIVHTGQHYDRLMSDVFFQDLEIPEPDFHLNIGSGSHGQQTGNMMIELEKLCLEHAFSSIVVIGDVNSTLAGALVGAKLRIPVVHIESGLRSFNRDMPEEINRIATDHISEILFAPTQRAMSNLEREGLTDRSYFSGDVMYDMILLGAKRAREKSGILKEMGLRPGTYYLATLHRPYNVDDPAQLKEIMNGLSGLDGEVILAAHPRTKKNMQEFGIDTGKNIRLTQPFGYLDFVELQRNARKIITDSGGVQKEAFFLQKPCITLRSETEWTETVETGANVLVKDRSEKGILEAVFRESTSDFEEKPYGEGKAGEIIVGILQSKFYS